MLYGLKDCANLTVKSKQSKEIALYADYAKTTTIEFTSEAIYAHSKSTKAVRWDKNREGTFKTSMEIFNMEIIAMLFGSQLENKAVPFMKRKVFTIGSGDMVLDENINIDSLAVYKLDPSDLKTNVAVIADADYSVEDNKLTITSSTAVAGDTIACYYMINQNAQTFTVDDVAFPGGYEIYGDTVLRSTDQEDSFVQFELMNVKPQSNVTLTMDVENACTLEITWDILADAEGNMMRWSKVVED